MLKKICMLFLLLCSLTGCAKADPKADAKAAAEAYAGLDALTMEAEITANSGAVITYRILFTRTAEGDQVEILAPDSLAGIRAKILPDKAEIHYDGMAVETLLPGISGYVPADAVTGALGDLANGVPETYGYSELDSAQTLQLTYVEEQEGHRLRKLLWLSPDDWSLLRGEFYLEEQMIMELSVKSLIR